jgi:radical SAM superfamily enzyme YgiQ (UPF0313 family)
MRVLLVSANRERIPDPVFPLGLAYVAAATKAAGHTVGFSDLCFGRRPLRSLRDTVNAFRPEVIGLSIRNVDNAAYPLTTDYLAWHRTVVDTLHQSSSAPVVLGGSAFSILPEAYMEALDGDWGISGEGEQRFVILLKAMEDGCLLPRQPGVYARPELSRDFVGIDDRFGHIPLRLAALHPERHSFGYARYVRRGGMGNIQTKRGCVFKCSYCTYPLLEGRRFRTREAADVVDEIEALMHDFGPHPVFFVDSILNFPHGHVEALCEEMLRRGLRIRWSCYATPVKLDRTQARLMARAGCHGIELGSDAVDDGQLARLGKSFDSSVVHCANRYCLEAGLRVCHSIIFGAPGETPDSVRATCTALRAMRPTAVVAMTGVRLYPGTPLTRRLVAEGRVEAESTGLAPAFYIEPGVRTFLPSYLRQTAREAGNWVLPGLAPPILPASQRIIRALGVSGPLWRLLQFPWMRSMCRARFRRPDTSWGIPNERRSII